MKDGFVRAAAIVPSLHTARIDHNIDAMTEAFKAAKKDKAQIMVFPELAVTGASCGDLFLQQVFLEKAREGLYRFVRETAGCQAVIFAGFPFLYKGKVYNTAAVIQDGQLIALIPKTELQLRAGFAEMRVFSPGPWEAEIIDLPEFGEVSFGAQVLIDPEWIDGLSIGCEIGEENLVFGGPGEEHLLNGALLVVNPTAVISHPGSFDASKKILQALTAKYQCAYLTAGSGAGDSTQDGVYDGRALLVENGEVLAEGLQSSEEDYNGTMIRFSEFDFAGLQFARRQAGNFIDNEEDYLHLEMPGDSVITPLSRKFRQDPFCPEPGMEDSFCEDVFRIQTRGLAGRLTHVHAQRIVLGISGGLDSTLALLVSARTCDLLKISRKSILAVTMPAFGTTDRTYRNACALTKALGAELREIRIAESVLQHFRDIGQDPQKHDAAYENSQARERTQILMDIANQCGGLVVGTGDLSELALGWATYNGDHMSMYGVNGGIPKTLVRRMAAYEARVTKSRKIRELLTDILDTPVSPELLPPSGKDVIAQKTEDLVGPYELHDYFLYHMMVYGETPAKMYRTACEAFKGTYGKAVILKWLKVFCRRFFSQQFKRSCMPDGPAVGPVSLSPRGGLAMPSDASSEAWLEEAEALK